MLVSSIYKYTTNWLHRRRSPLLDPLAKLNKVEYYLAADTNKRGNYGCASSECSVWNWKLVNAKRPVSTPKAHDYTVVRREAERPLDHGVTMRFGVSSQEHEGTAQRRINANAKICKCE
eukprot:6200422-Pleurochrysis_carterae.AAC.1